MSKTKSKDSKKKRPPLGLNNLTAPQRAIFRRKRVGRGSSSGHGKTSGRGHKGQKARSGGPKRPGFEGGQMPLIRRIPKRGFTNIFKKEYAIINLDILNRFKNDTEVTLDLLKKEGLIKNRFEEFKILGKGELKKALKVKTNMISQSARKKITEKGGKVEVIGKK